MFKKNSTLRRTIAASAWPCALLLLLTATACSTAPLPKVNLAEPGWHSRRGEAVWRANRDAPEIAGELLLATRAPGETFVQFTKTPFPFVVARTTTNSWQIESPTQNKRYSGRGSPPARLIWLQLPRALSGAALPEKWSWHLNQNRWRLENHASGESLEGYFTP